eukprot:1156570-Pelagomonas_calceolata.AAC.3
MAPTLAALPPGTAAAVLVVLRPRGADSEGARVSALAGRAESAACVQHDAGAQCAVPPVNSASATCEQCECAGVRVPLVSSASVLEVRAEWVLPVLSVSEEYGFSVCWRLGLSGCFLNSASTLVASILCLLCFIGRSATFLATIVLMYSARPGKQAVHRLGNKRAHTHIHRHGKVPEPALGRHPPPCMPP